MKHFFVNKIRKFKLKLNLLYIKLRTFFTTSKEKNALNFNKSKQYNLPSHHLKLNMSTKISTGLPLYLQTWKNLEFDNLGKKELGKTWNFEPNY